ncbi:MAG TPA: cytochrome c [Candidatus Acidoferrales bacterium]|nr:cytochrome c [Candidatus Acidoferrales bacterium]
MRSAFLKHFAPALALAACATVAAQTPDYKNVGRTPTAQEVQAMDIAIGTDGKELPPGSGNAKAGARIFSEKCMACHGENLQGSAQAPALVGGKGTLTSLHPMMTAGSYWPFATTIFDYIRRAMPRYLEGTLKVDEVYSLTAFILYRNDIIKEDEVIDAATLPKIKMPNRDGFVPQNLDEIHDWKKRGCKLGHCP